LDYFGSKSLTRLTGQRGRLLATLLAGAWRTCPPELRGFAEALAALAPLLVESGAASLVWRRVRDCDSLDSRVAQQLQQAYRYSTIQGDLHQHEIKLVFTLLRSVGVEPVLVKGWAAARLYPKVGLRPSGDIDLCVHPAQYDRAEAALNDWTDHQFALDLHKGFSTLDQESADVLYSRSQLVGLGDVNIRVLAREDHLRVLCLHFLRHGAFRPLWLCDIAAAVEGRPSDFDWDLCLSRNRRRADWVACTIGLAHQLLGASVDDTPVKRRSEQLPGWLIPTALRQWDAPSTMEHGVMRHRAAMVSYLRHPSGLLNDLRNRWPNPIEATVNLRGPFNEFPRLPFQVGECIARTAKFVVRLPRALRSSQ
jgi:hypothetical protein